MAKVVIWRVTFFSCPGDWLLLPWIETSVHGWMFSWLFGAVARFVVSASVDDD